MTTFVLIPGAGGQAWYWSRLVPELERRGHRAIAVELPATDDRAGLAAYTEAVLAAVAGFPAPATGQAGGGAGSAAPRGAGALGGTSGPAVDADELPARGGGCAELGGAAGAPTRAGSLAVASGRGPRGGVVAEVAARAVGASELVVVAQSMGGFTGPLVCARIPVAGLVLLNAMTPLPGETAGAWWQATGQGPAARALAEREGRDPDAPFDPVEIFLHDVPADVLAEALAGPPPGQSDTPFSEPWPLPAWPDVPTRFLAGRADRLFPLEFQQRVVRERLGIEVEELPGGHLLALSEPVALAEALTAGR